MTNRRKFLAKVSAIIASSAGISMSFLGASKRVRLSQKLLVVKYDSTSSEDEAYRIARQLSHANVPEEFAGMPIVVIPEGVSLSVEEREYYRPRV